MDLDRLKAFKEIDPCPPIPWESSVFEEIEIEEDREKAIKEILARQAETDLMIYSDASAQQG
jgi:chaperone required for assembly of F1-ATPase